MKEVWQQRMDAAFDRYFAMSKLLQEDLNALLERDDDSQSHRRNFVRAAASLVEGYAACFREMSQIGLDTGSGPLNAKEVKALTEERAFGAADRVKYTLQASYKLFQLPEAPQFAEDGWADAQLLLAKRDSLMHPKSTEDLTISDDLWDRIHRGITWLFSQLFGFMSQLARVHGT